MKTKIHLPSRALVLSLPVSRTMSQSKTKHMCDWINGEQFIVEFSDTLVHHHHHDHPHVSNKISWQKEKKSLGDISIWFSQVTSHWRFTIHHITCTAPTTHTVVTATFTTIYIHHSHSGGWLASSVQLSTSKNKQIHPLSWTWDEKHRHS